MVFLLTLSNSCPFALVDGSDDTLDIPVMDDVEGEYTEQLRRRESSPNAFMELDNQPPKPTRKPLKKQEKYSPISRSPVIYLRT